MTASARDLDLRQHHGIETPEHVDVQFELAGVGSRLAAGLLDLVLLILGLLALWIGGALIILLVGQSGSTARMAGESRVVYLGGRFAPGSDIAMPQSPLAFIPIGIAVIGIGVLVYLL